MRFLSIARHRQFMRDRSGASAVEFALISTPFFVTVAGLIEIGLVFLAQTSFERQLDSAARMVQTGQIQNADWDQSQMKSYLCAAMFVQNSCVADLRLDVRPLTSGSQTSSLTSTRLENDGLFGLGAGDDLVLIRAELAYEPFFAVGGIGPLTDANGEPFTFSAAMAVRNEPF